MPIRINEILTHSEEEFDQMTEDIIGLITLGKAAPCGEYYDEQNKLRLVAYDLKDADKGDAVLRCVFTLQENGDKNEIIGVDVVIPNDRIQSLDFIEKEEEESHPYQEVWNIENDDKRSYK